MPTQSNADLAADTGEPDEPRPWGPEDRPHIRRVERPPYRGPRNDVTVSFVVPVSQEQSAWLRAEEDRTGLNAIQLIQHLVEEARLRGQSEAEPSEPPAPAQSAPITAHGV